MSKWAKGLLLFYWLLAPVVVTGVVAQIVSGLPFTLTNGTVADATQVMADFNQIVNNVNANAAKNGVNSDITALSALVTPITPAQGGSTAYAATAASTSAANTQVIATVVPATFALTANYAVTFVPGFTNTGAMTLAVAGTAAKNVFKQSSSGSIALIGGEVRAGEATTAVYDGTQYVLLAYPNAFGASTVLASAATTDLGTISTHNVSITGVTGITSFGSSAQIDFPFYFLRFASALTITPGASLFVPGNAVITTAGGDTAIAQYFGTGIWVITNYVRAATAPFGPFTAPTVQNCTSGLTCDGSSHTYTPTAGMVRIHARICGGGGGGGAQATNNGTTGNTTTFDTWTAIGGAGGGNGGTNGTGGLGGTGGANGTGTLAARFDGQQGGRSTNGATAGPGGQGGNSAFFAGAGGSSITNGQNGRSNSGGGGSGGGTAGTAQGAGGGGGECAEFWMTAAQVGASKTYTAGAAANGGAAGTQAGGNGAAGPIIVEEFYW